MEQNKPQMWKVILNYGLITSVIIIIYSLILYVTGMLEKQTYLNLLVFLILLGGIIWSTKSFRDINNNGLCTYGQAFTVGFFVGFIAVFIYAVFNFFLYKFDPLLVENMIQRYQDMLYETTDYSVEEIEEKVEQTRKLTSAFTIMIGTFIQATVINLVMSLIVAVFIRREYKY